MSLTAEQRNAHQRYEDADPLIQKTVDAAYTAARKAITDTGMDAAGDDRAEALVAAILVYIEESAKSEPDEDGVDEQIWLPGGHNYTTDKR